MNMNKTNRLESISHATPLFQVLLGIGLGWLMSHIMTISGALPNDPNKLGYKARSDARTEVISRAQWAFFPYPGRFR